jgi:hypothetical protein
MLGRLVWTSRDESRLVLFSSLLLAYAPPTSLPFGVVQSLVTFVLWVRERVSMDLVLWPRQRPVHLGLRFSTKALAPSTRSSVVRRSVARSFSSLMPSASGSPRPPTTDSFA